MRLRALALLATFALPSLALAQESAGGTLFDALYTEYEAVRQALAADRPEGVDRHGADIEGLLLPFEGELVPARAGIEAADAEELGQLLPELAQAAHALAAATSLDEARDAFYALTKPMVRYWKLVPGDRQGVVAYCSMARRSWLQPAGGLGNPYYGDSMDTCGEVVSP